VHAYAGMVISMPLTHTPDLGSYDLVLVNTSAGKDSQAMLDYVVEQADAQGVDRSRIVCFHADLGRVEWPGTAELAEAHAEAYGLRIVRIARPQGDLLDHIEARGMFPSSAARYCTSDHKRGQAHKALTMLTRELGLGRPARILNCMGLRAQESAARAKRVPLSHDAKASNKTKRTVTEWLPILDWTADQVWARIAQAPTQAHPAYAAGMPRLSCCFCVLASKGALVRAAQLMPALAEEYRQVEVRIGHRFTEHLSMGEIIAQAAQGEPVEVLDWAA
jgi:3'-phosphoadenosine 5'-phosphosulfate sulfotransferase (PAPS reductase)/FAD synthetase